MSTLFWVGIAVFALGLIYRMTYKIIYYKDYSSNGHTEMRRQEMRTKYRPKFYIGLVIQILGVPIMLLAA